jgi:hypothetical protein
MHTLLCYIFTSYECSWGLPQCEGQVFIFTDTPLYGRIIGHPLPFHTVQIRCRPTPG